MPQFCAEHVTLVMMSGIKSTKKWWMATGLTTVLVAGGLGAGALYNHNLRLYHDPAPTAAPPARAATTWDNNAQIVVDNAALTAKVEQLLADPALGVSGAYIVDTATNESLINKDAGTALRPASSTKVLTAAASLLEKNITDTLTTNVYRIDNATVVIKASGDVWFNAQRVDQLAADIAAAVPEVDTVLVDTSVWQAPAFAQSWDPVDIDAGYIAPMEPIMLYGARIDATEGDVPRSHSPALDVAAAIAQRVGATHYDIAGDYSVAAEQPIASSQSPTLEWRLTQMMTNSDNVMAEAIARELDPQNPAQHTLDVLKNAGFNTEEVALFDNSGLSDRNRITPQLLGEIMAAAVHADQSANTAQLSALISALPVAGGTGTLATRYNEQAGRGWVRAKTGTLSATSALAGVVPSDNGHIYAFGIISNDSDIQAARGALDLVASALKQG
ncbi:D-alanyl-D-alanine carboxypeptidase/D-alanyl-D-alanine-endopeptidase [Corynebacterium sp. SY003]|uniref:D-alanyl-D-alanine carboxypeptidase/D-alanyl-D-alanine endopeptidase n=2 Tax=unclassified Corynebacterium TaxID=2624378 RepID=UPI00351B07A0